MGSDIYPTESVYTMYRFNPRSRMGSDGITGRADGVGIGFNPRSRMGSDLCARLIWESLNVSIHAPAWGATT